MANAAVIDLERLLAPIDGPDPAGRDLAYEPEYDAIREARRADDEVPQGSWERALKVADWDLVIELASADLAEKSKDLQIAAWLTEALGRLHGFAGLRDGFRLLHQIQVRYWESYYPRIDDGDLDPRAGVFDFLSAEKLLPTLVRSQPLTREFKGDRYSFFRWRESRETTNLGKKDKAAMQALIAKGKIAAETFDDAVAAGDRAFYESVTADLLDAEAALKELEQGTDARFGRAAPSLRNVRKALEDCRQVLEPILAQKRLKEPDPEPVAEAEAEAATEADGQAADVDALDAGTAAAPGPRRIPAIPGLGADVLDHGRLLIEFRERAVQLAEAGARLEENRKKHAELVEQIKLLDQEYEEVSRLVGRDRAYFELLARVVRPRAPA